MTSPTSHPFIKWFADITIDTESGFREAVMISSAYGLGENVVQGSLTPDEFLVFKPTLKTGHRPVLQKTIGSKEFKLVYL